MSRFISDDTMFAGRPFLEDNGIEFAHDAPMRHRHHHGPVPPHGWPPHRPVFIYGNGASDGALAYKGTVSSESDLLHVRLSKGECYVVSVAGEYAGQQYDVGDLIIVNASGTYVTSDELAAAISSLQSNVDMSDYVATADLPDMVGQIVQAGSHISIAQDEGHSIVSAVTSPIADDAGGLAIAGDVYDAIMDAIGGGGSIANTTYTLSKSDNVITLEGSDGSSSEVTDTIYSLAKNGSTIILYDTDGGTTGVTDDNTTYSLSKNGSTISLVGSDGRSNSVTDSDTTYSLSKSGSTITLTDSDGGTTDVTDSDTTDLMQMTGTLPIGHGGTGQTSANAAAHALGLAKTAGDTFTMDNVMAIGYLNAAKTLVCLCIPTPFRFYDVSSATLSGTYTIRQYNGVFLFGSTASTAPSLSGRVSAVNVKDEGYILANIGTGSAQGSSAIAQGLVMCQFNTLTITLR